MREPEPIKGIFNTEVKRTAQEIAIRKRGTEITQKAIAHFDKYQSTWINKRYGALINSVAAPGPQLTPNGQRKPASEVAYEIASKGVHSSQASRLDKIKNSVERMTQRAKGNEVSKPREQDKGLSR